MRGLVRPIQISLRRAVAIVTLIAAILGALPHDEIGLALAAFLAAIALLAGVQAVLLLLVRRQIAPPTNKKRRRVPERQDRAHGPRRR